MALLSCGDPGEVKTVGRAGCPAAWSVGWDRHHGGLSRCGSKVAPPGTAWVSLLQPGTEECRTGVKPSSPPSSAEPE